MENNELNKTILLHTNQMEAEKDLLEKYRNDLNEFTSKIERNEESLKQKEENIETINEELVFGGFKLLVYFLISCWSSSMILLNFF